MATERKYTIGRRSVLLAAGSLAAAPLLGGIATRASAQGAAPSTTPAAQATGRHGNFSMGGAHPVTRR
jgi:hypothetical protein